MSLTCTFIIMSFKCSLQQQYTGWFIKSVAVHSTVTRQKFNGLEQLCTDGFIHFCDCLNK